jgi:putative phosphoesterase
MRARPGPAASRHDARASLATRDDGTLRLAIVADTHSQPHPRTLEHLAALEPDAILHAGDIGDLAVLDELATVAPVHAVRGNIDVRARDLPDALVIDVTDRDAPRLRILVTHIAVDGPRLRGDAVKLAREAGAALVVCGHSHVPFIGTDRGLAVFNPGSAGPRRFTLPIVFGTLAIDRERIRLAHVDCETGAPWAPP